MNRTYTEKEYSAVISALSGLIDDTLGTGDATCIDDNDNSYISLNMPNGLLCITDNNNTGKYDWELIDISNNTKDLKTTDDLSPKTREKTLREFFDIAIGYNEQLRTAREKGKEKWIKERIQ